MIKQVGENILQIPELNCEKTKQDIVNFIQSKVSEAKADGIIVGLSGGIDSTLSAYLACEALGKDKVFGIIMPSTTTPTEDKLHGIEIAQKLGISEKTVRNHISNTMQKLEVKSRAQAVVELIKLGELNI